MKDTLKILSCLCCSMKVDIRKETKEDGYHPEVCCVRCR